MPTSGVLTVDCTARATGVVDRWCETEYPDEDAELDGLRDLIAAELTDVLTEVTTKVADEANRQMAFLLAQPGTTVWATARRES